MLHHSGKMDANQRRSVELLPCRSSPDDSSEAALVKELRVPSPQVACFYIPNLIHMNLYLCFAVYPASSIPDLSAIDVAVSALELQVQTIKDNFRNEMEVIPKAKNFIREEKRCSFSWHGIQWIKKLEFVTLASEALLHAGRITLLTLQYGDGEPTDNAARMCV